MKYQAQDFNITNKNPLFSEAKIYVMYHGENRNNSYIAREDVDKALQTIYNIPIVGEFVEAEGDDEESNFGSHGGKVVIDDKGMKYIHTTRPVGVVPESANVYWETIKDEKDRVRDYLVVDGALVWNRYEDEVNTLKSANFGQSMEIEVNDGWFDGEDGNYHITDFAFSAFCILGIDGKKNGKVEPAFEDSKIITYSKEEISQEFKEMKEELQEYYTSYAKGKEDNAVEDEKNLDKDLDKDIKDENTDEQNDTNQEPEVIQNETEGVAGQVITDEEEAEKNQGTSGDTTGTGDVDTGSDARAIADANTDTTADTGTDTDATATTDTTSEARTVADANTDYAEENKSLKGKISELETELESLKEFKKEVEKERHEQKAVELFDKFGLGEDDISDLDIYAYSIEELEEKCFAILGKKAIEGNVEFSAKETKKTNKVQLSQASAEKSATPYGRLFEKYSK